MELIGSTWDNATVLAKAVEKHVEVLNEPFLESERIMKTPSRMISELIGRKEDEILYIFLCLLAFFGCLAVSQLKNPVARKLTATSVGLFI